MIVLDTSLLIAHVEAADVHHHRARQILIEYRRHQFVCSAITMAEFLVLPAQRGRLAAARRVLDALAIRSDPVDAGAAGRLTELRVATGLALPDCCVLYTAERHNGCLIATFGDTLRRQAHRLGIGTAD